LYTGKGIHFTGDMERGILIIFNVMRMSMFKEPLNNGGMTSVEGVVYTGGFT
jgi:hypothetical protein